MSNKPIISIVIPVYNGAKYLRQAIDSVMFQTWQDFELIIVDNASSDKTLEVSNSYNDSRVSVYSETDHLPIYANFNRAASYASGKYIKFLCADDLLLPLSLETLVTSILKDPHIGLVTSQRIAIDAAGKHLRLLYLEHRGGLISGKEALQLVSKLNNFIGEPSCVLIDKEIFTSLGGFDNRFCQLGDLHLWCRILSTNDLYYIQTPLSCYRLHTDQLTHHNLRNMRLRLREDRWIRDTLKGLGYHKDWVYRFLYALRKKVKPLRGS